MAFDGIVTTAVARELQEKLTGGRIDRVYQPSVDEIFELSEVTHIFFLL